VTNPNLKENTFIKAYSDWLLEWF